jgi:hypothetical protein
MSIPNENLMNGVELSEALGLSYNRTKIITQEAGFPKIRIGNRAYFKLDSVLAWLNEREINSINKKPEKKPEQLDKAELVKTLLKLLEGE